MLVNLNHKQIPVLFRH